MFKRKSLGEASFKSQHIPGEEERRGGGKCSLSKSMWSCMVAESKHMVRRGFRERARNLTVLEEACFKQR